MIKTSSLGNPKLTLTFLWAPARKKEQMSFHDSALVNLTSKMWIYWPMESVWGACPGTKARFRDLQAGGLLFSCSPNTTAKEVRVTAVHVLVKAGTSTGHESACYGDTAQKARSKGRQTPLIKSQEHLQFILGEIPWLHPRLGSSDNAGATKTFLIREQIGITHPGTSCRILPPRQT